MWKAVSLILAGVVPGIILGLGIAAFFINAPIQAQLEAARGSENRMSAKVARLEGQLAGTAQTINDTADAINKRGVQNSANLEQIREVCRAEQTRAVAAGQAISRITESSRRTASAVTDLAAQCPANRLITSGQLRPVLGQAGS